MRIKTTKRIPNKVIERELKEKPKALLYYLYSKANKKLDSRIFNICKCSYNELLELELLKTTDNTKNNRKAIRKLLDELDKASYIDYELDKDNNLIIEVCITEPCKTKGDFTQLPYSIVNNKDIPLIVVPTYIAIFKYDYRRGECNPSVPTLAKYSGCSKPTLLKRLETLKELEILDISKSKGGHTTDTNTYFTSNKYLIGEDGDFYYTLIDVENPRFELPKKKILPKKGSIVKDSLKETTLEQEELLEDVW